jgi:hypothetical protein
MFYLAACAIYTVKFVQKEGKVHALHKLDVCGSVKVLCIYDLDEHCGGILQVILTSQ